MVERITDHPLLHDERLVSLGLAYATAGVDIHAWARDRGGGAPSARKNGRRVSFNDKSLVSVREIEAREEPPEPEIKAIPKGTSKVRHSALSLFVADRIDASLAGAERAAATSEDLDALLDDRDWRGSAARRAYLSGRFVASRFVQAQILAEFLLSQIGVDFAGRSRIPVAVVCCYRR